MTTLLVANDGGHLAQLHALAPRLGSVDRAWVTVRTPQSESLLAGETVTWVPDARTRDTSAAVRNAWLTRHLLRGPRVSQVVSTGSSLALSVLPHARARGIRTVYVESATRVEGPSLTGRVLARMPGTRLYTQHGTWADERWRYGGSVFDGWEVEVDEVDTTKQPTTFVVSLGTSETYSFRRLIEHLLHVLPRDAEVLWQTGSTDVTGLPIVGRRAVPAAELRDAMVAADVVIAHAGTGIALTALQAGHKPVLVARDHRRGEHVDDHQQQIAQDLDRRGLAWVRDVDHVDERTLAQAAGSRVRSPEAPPPFRW